MVVLVGMEGNVSVMNSERKIERFNIIHSKCQAVISLFRLIIINEWHALDLTRNLSFLVVYDIAVG